jgi:hypothetical protein
MLLLAAPSRFSQVSALYLAARPLFRACTRASVTMSARMNRARSARGSLYQAYDQAGSAGAEVGAPGRESCKPVADFLYSPPVSCSFHLATPQDRRTETSGDQPEHFGALGEGPPGGR